MMSNTPPFSPDMKCANCGKGEENSGDLKACTACKMVNYCNRECQIAHRPQHKKACKKRAAELYDAALFKEHPPDDCPICMLPLPLYDNHTGTSFHSCCGKDICSGCIYTTRETGDNNMKLCPFCKTPPPRSNEEAVNRTKKLLKTGNAQAFYMLAGCYEDGIMGLPQDRAKARELYLKAGELGCAVAYYNLGQSYLHRTGNGVEIDAKKSNYYWELAATNGHIKSRHNLGVYEYNAGNHHRAMKHFVISASAGYKKSLDMINKGYMAGYVTKKEYASTLREYQKCQDEMKSDARDKAWAARNARIGG